MYVLRGYRIGLTRERRMIPCQRLKTCVFDSKQNEKRHQTNCMSTAGVMSCVQFYLNPADLYRQ